MTCTAVQELYRSSLVCPLIPILKGVFWSKRQSCTVSGKYVNWNLSFKMGKWTIIAMNFQSDLYGRTGTVQVKSGMSIDSHLERCLLVQTAELYSPGKYVNQFDLSRWEMDYDSYGEFSKFLYGRTGTVQVKSPCPLIPILKGVFWSKRQSCTVLGSMLTEI